MARNAPSNTDDVIDSRDILSRIEELQAERDGFQSELDVWDTSAEGKEFAALTALSDECASYSPDWEHGETLVRDSYFAEYTEELAIDCGYIERDQQDKWPYTCIDWERAAEGLQQDYALVSFDGVEYWVRSC